MKTQKLLVKYACLCVITSMWLATSNVALFAQEKTVGDLTISGAGAVTVNGENAASGRTIASPSEIATTGQATAKISIAKAGVVILAPNSRMNLSFNSSSISGDFLAGRLTVDVLPNASLNLQTPDGAITTAGRSEETVVNIDFDNGKTRISTLSGAVNFNGVSVPAGQVYSASGVATNSGQSSGGGSSNKSAGGSSSLLLILLAVAGAAGVGVALGLKGSNDSTPVSPTR